MHRFTQFFLAALHASPANLVFSHSCGLFFSLYPLFAARLVCFQQLADSLCKTPGVWGPSATSPRLCVTICLYFVAPLFSSTYKSLLVTHRFATFCLFKHLQTPFPATSLYSHLYKTPECGIQIMAKHRLSHASPGGGSFFRGIKEFDSYERNFGLESRCWSIIRATNRACTAQGD